MAVNRNIEDLLQSATQPFSIIEEYAALSPKRKFLLCDQLFIEGERSFENMVRLLWPEAEGVDIQKLQKFLVLIREAKPENVTRH